MSGRTSVDFSVPNNSINAINVINYVVPISRIVIRSFMFRDVDGIFLFLSTTSVSKKIYDFVHRNGSCRFLYHFRSLLKYVI